jgi:hypothetical protein
VAYARRMATKSEADPVEARPRVLSRSTVAPAAGIGVIAAIIAAQEHAPWSVSVIVAVTVPLVVVGMIALKRAFHGD